jgi:V8-like Glu-specific endopeptidase
MSDWNFETDDFDRLKNILRDLPDMEQEDDRWRFIHDVLGGIERQKTIRGLLKLRGNPNGAAVTIITQFKRFGKDDTGKELIGILINKMLDGYVMDMDDQVFLRGLFEKYPLESPVIPSRRLDTPHDPIPDELIPEKIIGENTLRDIVILERALEASKAVVHIRTPNGQGTGFLVAPDLIMTNNHVIPNPETANRNTFTFNYQLNRQQKPALTQSFTAKTDGLFFTNENLDVTVVQLEKPVPDVTPLTLKPGRVRRDDRVSIIQHPGGHYKQIAMQNNFAEYADSTVVQYITSTMPGSSGSPVFDEDYHVIAIHHSGGTVRAPNTQRRYLRNAGTSMIAVINTLREHHPDIARQLKLWTK